MEIIDHRALHRRALERVTPLVEQVRTVDLGRSTPCPPWDLKELLSHMIGQNHGFAAAVTDPSGAAPLAAFAPRTPAGEPGADWTTSAKVLTEAFAACDLERPVVLAEFGTELRFPCWLVIGFQLLDTVVHGWDVATALGLDHRPDDELVTATLDLARLVPTGEAREVPGAPFAPVLDTDATDDWSRALALLGRSEGATRLG